jgi:hypothetical protein
LASVAENQKLETQWQEGERKRKFLSQTQNTFYSHFKSQSVNGGKKAKKIEKWDISPWEVQLPKDDFYEIF